MDQFDQFREVTSEIHRLIGIEPKAVLGSDDTRWVTDFDINGVDMAIMYSKQDNPYTLSLVCVFGTAGDVNRVEAWTRLLSLNFSLLMSGNGAFTINPKTNEVVFMAQILIERLTSQSVLTALVQLADQANVWRSTRYLDVAVDAQDVLALCTARA